MRNINKLSSLAQILPVISLELKDSVLSAASVQSQSSDLEIKPEMNYANA